MAYLCPDDITMSRKLGNIRQVWKWSGEPFPEDSDWVAEEVLDGAGNMREQVLQYEHPATI